MKYTMKRTAAGDIAITQYVINGWDVSYNPDDELFYVVKSGKTCRFARWNNATYYAKTH